MGQPEVVIFDCDGVLVDSERLIQEVDLELIRDLGWPITREEIFAEPDLALLVTKRAYCLFREPV